MLLNKYIVGNSNNLIYHTFKIYIINEWCFIRFLMLIKFQYFSVFRRHNYIAKVFIFPFFMRLKFVFCVKRMKTTQTIKIPIFYVIPLNNADNSSTARRRHRLLDLTSDLHFSIFGIIQRITCFSLFELCFEI